MLKLQFMTVRMDVTKLTTKEPTRTNLATSVFLTANLISDFGFCLNKEQFGLI